MIIRHMEEKFKTWITSFHMMRVHGFISERESKIIWNRILKTIKISGYKVEDIGFYEWKFTKID